MHKKTTVLVYLRFIIAGLDAAAAPSGICGLAAATCYDRDKQAWAFEADTHSEMLRVRVMYRDVRNVPRNHIR